MLATASSFVAHGPVGIDEKWRSSDCVEAEYAFLMFCAVLIAPIGGECVTMTGNAVWVCVMVLPDAWFCG